MKVTVESKFHGRSAVVTVRGDYQSDDLDPIALLEYEVYSGGADKTYASRKLAEIKRKVCGVNDCKCAITVHEVKNE